jgi:hypothetical protein
MFVKQYLFAALLVTGFALSGCATDDMKSMDDSMHGDMGMSMDKSDKMDSSMNHDMDDKMMGDKMTDDKMMDSDMEHAM